MKKVLLHIGRAKTGTTAIQECLMERGDLLRQGGFIYPAPVLEGKINHNSTFANLASLPKSASPLEHCPERKTLFERYSEKYTNIISAECLQNANPAHVAELFTGLETDVVCYLRNEISLLLSSYCQQVKGAKLQSNFRDFLLPRISFLNYLKFLDHWHAAFEGRVECRVYNPDFLHNADSIQDFNKHFLNGALDDVSFFSRTRLNPTLSLPALNLTLYMNRNQQNFEWFFHDDNARSRINALHELSKRHPQKVYLPTEFREQLRSTFSERQLTWAPKYFGVSKVFDYSQDLYMDQEQTLPETERRLLLEELRTIFVEQANERQKILQGTLH